MNPVYIPRYSKKKADRSEIVEADVIFKTVQEYFGITREDIFKKSRKVSILYPRQVCIWLLAKYSIHSVPGIGVIFGHADQSSASNSVNVIDNYLSYDDEVKKQIDDLKALIMPIHKTDGNS